jgi:hypothetical protein
MMRWPGRFGKWSVGLPRHLPAPAKLQPVHYQKLLAAMPWRRIGVLVRAGARQLAVGRAHADYSSIASPAGPGKSRT